MWVNCYSFLTFALVAGQWSASSSGHFTHKNVFSVPTEYEDIANLFAKQEVNKLENKITSSSCN
jgi:hypothetical protein